LVHQIAVIAGDGIGPEVTTEAMATLEAAAPGLFVFNYLPYSADHTLATGTTISPVELQQIRSQHAAVFVGALGDPRIPDHRHARDVLLGMRREFDLYINLRPIRLRAAHHCALKRVPEDGIDFVIFRENTEGLYSGIGGVLHAGTPHELALSQMVATRHGTERIVRAAFACAVTRPRRRCCLVSKHNAVTHAFGLWHAVFCEVAAEFPEVTTEVLYADTAALEFVRRPDRFDVVVTSNMVGDILSDLGAQLVGGIGLAPSSNIHPDGPRRFGLFEPIHGSAPDIAGKAQANPTGAILAAGLMAEFCGEVVAAQAMERAIQQTLASGAATHDLQGHMSSAEFGALVRTNLSPNIPAPDAGPGQANI